MCSLPRLGWLTRRICRQLLFTQASLHLHNRAGVFSFHFPQESHDFARHKSFQSNTVIESLFFEIFHRCDRQQTTKSSDVACQFLFEEILVYLGVPALRDLIPWRILKATCRYVFREGNLPFHCHRLRCGYSYLAATSTSISIWSSPRTAMAEVDYQIVIVAFEGSNFCRFHDSSIEAVISSSTHSLLEADQALWASSTVDCRIRIKNGSEIRQIHGSYCSCSNDMSREGRQNNTSFAGGSASTKSPKPTCLPPEQKVCIVLTYLDIQASSKLELVFKSPILVWREAELPCHFEEIPVRPSVRPSLEKIKPSRLLRRAIKLSKSVREIKSEISGTKRIHSGAKSDMGQLLRLLEQNNNDDVMMLVRMCREFWEECKDVW